MTFIHCRTGCTCCSDDNHYRGPYATRADAERRVNFFLVPTAVNNPVASQYARKGCYEIVEEPVEMLGNDRIIIGERVHRVLQMVTVNSDGSTPRDDFFAEELY